jgi:DNA polymerase-1
MRRELSQKILDQRELATTYRTFIQGVWNKIETDGKLHPDWTPTGTDTGRWSCRTPNLQNQPKGIRNQYMASDGHVFFIGDYSQLELLIGAVLSEDKFLYDAITSGDDVHEMTRQELIKIIPTADRMLAKTSNFGTVYGLSPRTLAMRLKVPVQTAEVIQNVVLKMFSQVRPFHDRNIEFWRKHGYLESYFGRRKYCEKVTEALNFPIQSCAFDVAGNALIKLDEEGFNLVWNVHDEDACEELINNTTRQRFQRFQQIMQNAAPSLCSEFPIEAYITKTWGDKRWLENNPNDLPLSSV